MAGALREILTEYGFGLDTSNIEAADGIVSGLGDKLLNLGKWVAGAFAVKAVVDFSNRLIDTADNLNDTSQRLNVGTDDLQAWHYAAKLNGIEADELNGSMQRLGAGIADAAAGAGQVKAYKKLGVELKNADGTLKGTAQVFEEAGLAIGALADPSEQAGLAADLFGKQYAKLLPLFRQGPEGIAALKEEFKKFGGGLSKEFIENAAEFNDQIDILKITGMSLSSELLAGLLPTLIDMAGAALNFGKALAGTSKETDFLSVLGRSIGNIVRALQRTTPATGAFSAGLRLAGKLARVLLEPLLLIEDFLVFLAGGDSVFGDWVEEAFGKGTAAKVQKWFSGVLTGINDVEFTVKELGFIFVGLGLTAVMTSDKIKSALLSIPTTVAVAFEDMWNGILDGAGDAIRRLGVFIGKLPGKAGEGAALVSAADALSGQKSFSAATQAEVQKADDLQRRIQVGQFAASVPGMFGMGPKDGATDVATQTAAAVAVADSVQRLAQTVAAQAPAATAPAAAAVASSSGPPQWLIDGIHVENKTYVTVPPGTDADVAKGVGDASNKGSNRGLGNLSATLAAATSG